MTNERKRSHDIDQHIAAHMKPTREQGQTPTPETDALMFCCGQCVRRGSDEFVDVDHARKLECQRDQLREDNGELVVALREACAWLQDDSNAAGYGEGKAQIHAWLALAQTALNTGSKA